MSENALPFDTLPFNSLPVSCFIYEPACDADGNVSDFRLVYANPSFAEDWKMRCGNDDYIGKMLLSSGLMDERTHGIMNGFRNTKPHAFSSYIPHEDLHIHFEPIKDIPEPYSGFFVINVTDYDKRESRIHFLKNIRQMNCNSVLMQRHPGGRLETVYVSDSFAEMMECSVDEAMQIMNGSGFMESNVPDDRPAVSSLLRLRAAADGSSDLTVRKITAKNNIIWCSIHFAFIEDFGDQYIYCTYTNITVLKTYEERLRNVYQSMGSNFYRNSGSTLALFRVNLTRNAIEEVKGTELFKKDSAEYSYSDMLAGRAVNLPIDSERTRFLETFDSVHMSESYLRGVASVSDMVYSRRPDGRLCYVNFTAALTRHPITGEITAFITEQECNEKKVRDILMSKILARQFDMVAYLAEGKYGVTIGDASYIKGGSIFPEKRYGEFAEYLGKQVFPVLAGDEAYRSEIAGLLSLEKISEGTKHNEPYFVNIAINIDGKIFYKRFDFYSVDPEADFYIVLKSDTTELRREQEERNEQLRTALAEAEQANIAKTAFLSSMSHEIRTPMNAIIGIDNIALNDPNLSPQTKEQLEKIGVSARHLLGLINDILDMSRIESGRMVLRNEEFSFGGFLEQINTLVASQCQDKGLSYECVINGKVDEYYIGDDMKLKQVLINILGNSVKFTPAPGKVTFAVEQTARFEDKAALRFTMRDTGIGMDKEYIPKIFEAFSQEDATTTNSYGGSGLGMAITKNIVEMMNGNISVTSEKGVGSEFTVNVTVRTTDRSDSAKAPEIRPQDLTVLVIDDDPVACGHATIVLDEMGIVSDYALSGREALEMLRLRHARRESYNLILVDLKMPEQDGVEVTRQIRELYNGDSAIIILTAYSWADVEEEARAAGVDGFMSKPLFATNLLEAVRSAAARRNLSADKKKADLTGRRILLAEDIEINAEIMMSILEMREIEADHAENGRIAVEMFTASPQHYYDAILMDMRMPEMDGLEAARAIRASDHPDAKKIPIIALTANAFDEDVQRSLQAGMNAHLSKPVEPDHLYETLEELIDG